MNEKLISTLCTNALALSGFSFTTLAVFLGFYKGDLWQAASVIQVLTVAAVLFLISSELAREATTLWEYLLSESLYYASSVGIFIGFINFTWTNLPNLGYSVLLALLVAVGVFLVKGIYSAKLFVERTIVESKR
ncbi:MAG: hypothetical protein ABSD99_10905 [Candidatus Bathyarchaeia archaeon]|jgi:hypothetical protein